MPLLYISVYSPTTPTIPVPDKLIVPLFVSMTSFLGCPESFFWAIPSLDLSLNEVGVVIAPLPDIAALFVTLEEENSDLR